MSGLVGFFLKRSIAVRRLIPDTVGDRILSGAVWAGPCDTRGKFAPPNLNLVPATFVPTRHFVKMRLPVHLAAANIFDRITRFAGEAFGIDGLGGRRTADGGMRLRIGLPHSAQSIVAKFPSVTLCTGEASTLSI